MAYRKNESDRQIDQIMSFYDHSDVTVNVDGKQRSVGNPTGAGDDRNVSKAGIKTYFKDRLDVFGDKAGKKRSADNNPIGAGHEG